VSDGRTPVGTIDQVGGAAFVATGIDGIIVGEFSTLREAVRAFDDGGAQ